MTDLDVHVSAIVAGDERAFGRWLAGAEHTLRLSLRSFAGSVDVESVVQETFLRVWQVAPKFTPDGRDNGLLRLAIRIGRNLAISEVRRLKTRPVEPEDLERQLAMIASKESIEDRDPFLLELIQRCRDKLPEQPAAALLARLTGAGTTDQDLAASVGMKKNTFLKNFGRARKLLESCLERGGFSVRGASV